MPHERRDYRRVSAAMVAFALSLPASVAAQDGADTTSAEWQSDGFDTANVSTAGWTVVSDFGRGLVTLENSTLVMRSSGDIAADSWREHHALHLTRPAPDTDFVVRTTFGTVPIVPYESEGLAFVNSEFDFLRIDLIGDPDEETRRLYAASSTRNTPLVHANVPVELAVPFDLEIRRDADLWTVTLIDAAGERELVTSFLHPIIIREFGPFTTSRGIRGRASFIDIDFVEGGGEPIVPLAVDQEDPLSQGLVIDSTVEGMTLNWTTDERTTAVVRLTDSGGDVIELPSPLQHDHRVALAEPVTNEIYDIEITSTDVSGNESVQTAVDYTYAPADLPVIEIYGGRDHTFGITGDPQPTASVTGIITSEADEYTVRWRLDDGDWEFLIPDPESTRTVNPGEFSIELEPQRITSLGTTMTIEVTELGETNEAGEFDPSLSVNAVDIRLQSLDNTGSEPDRTVSWDGDDVELHAQAANGGWRLVPGGVKPITAGPQRVLLIGDQSWSNYEVTTSFVAGEAAPSTEAERIAPWAGVILGWRGFDPTSENDILRSAGGAGFGFGAGGVTVAGVRDETRFIDSTAPVEIEPGVRYHLRARAETVRTGTEVRMKMWRDGVDEPDGWTIEHLNVGARAGGSLALVAHRWDLMFGPVTVEPLG